MPAQLESGKGYPKMIIHERNYKIFSFIFSNPIVWPGCRRIDDE